MPGGKIAYDIAGEGPTVVFVHAAIADRRMWDREFHEYATKGTAVRYDVRGFGKSPAATAPYSDVDDLRALLRHLGPGPVTLVGCSNGGRLAIDFALEHRSSVLGMLLVSPGLSGFAAELEPDGAADYERDGVRSSAIWKAWKAGRKDEALEQLREYWASAQTGANLELVRQMMRDNASEIFTDQSAQHSQPISPPAAKRLKSLRVPTVVLYGDRDEPTMRYIVRHIVANIPHSRLVTIPGGDHLLNLSRPEEFDRAFRELLAHERK